MRVYRQNLFELYDKTLSSAVPYVNAYKCKNHGGALYRKRRQSQTVHYT